MNRFSWILVGGLLLLTAVLAACESEPNPDQSLSGRAFSDVCRAVTGLNNAQPYTPADGPNTMILMSNSTIGAQYDEYTIRYPRELPEAWFPSVVDGTADYSNVEIVACVTRTAAEETGVCEFEDGYTMILHDSTYELTLRDARTAEVLDSTTLQNTGECPQMFGLFSDGETEVDRFADVTDEQMRPFLEPYVTGS